MGPTDDNKTFHSTEDGDPREINTLLNDFTNKSITIYFKHKCLYFKNEDLYNTW